MQVPDNYFEYALSRCKSMNISAICEIVPTQAALRKKADKGFNGCRNITADWRLFKVVDICLHNDKIIDHIKLSEDALTIYQRCIDAELTREGLTYSFCFDRLADLIWLLSSVHISRNERKNSILLLSDKSAIRTAIKEYLFGLYNSAVLDNNECVYIDEAQKARNKFFSGLYPFKFEESMRYLSLDYTSRNLDEEYTYYKNNSLNKMALFYGLTATAALIEDIRRFG